jgi:hypothetical protein
MPTASILGAVVHHYLLEKKSKHALSRRLRVLKSIGSVDAVSNRSATLWYPLRFTPTNAFPRRHQWYSIRSDAGRPGWSAPLIVATSVQQHPQN